MSIEQALGMDLKKLHGTKKNHDFKHGYPTHPRYKKNWDTHYKFTVVRNPWARLVSSYFFDLHHATKRLSDPPEGVSNKKQAWWKRRRLGLRPRRKLIFDYGADGFVDCMKKYLPRWAENKLIYKPQSRWLRPGQPGQALSAYDRICLLENITEDFALVCEDLGTTAELPCINSTSHKPYREHYDGSLIALVESVYQKDIERFSYEF
jgi:hypothetical protein